MTKIRLARTGSTHQPHYRIVVADSRKPRNGRFLEILGSYHPIHGGDVTVNKERAEYWISVGAQPSNTVIGLLNRSGVKHSYTVRRKPQQSKAVAEESKAEKVEAPVEPEATEAGDEVIAEAPLSDEAAEASSEQPTESEAA